MTSDNGPLITAALAAARLRAARTALLALHKVILDAERLRYEQARDRIDNTQELLRLVMDDPWFAWLRPLAGLIVQADERLADGVPVQPADVEAFVEQVRGLLRLDLGGPKFRERYQQLLQEEPDVVVAHGKVLAMV